MRLAHVAIVVSDYDEAIDYYTTVLGFSLVEDTPQGDGKRWVVVAPDRSSGAALVLALARTPEQLSRVGNQTGGRVFLFVHTTDFDADYARLRAAGVRFVETPRSEAYGRVVVFVDLYGNKWDLVARRQESVP